MLNNFLQWPKSRTKLKGIELRTYKHPHKEKQHPPDFFVQSDSLRGRRPTPCDWVSFPNTVEAWKAHSAVWGGVWNSNISELQLAVWARPYGCFWNVFTRCLILYFVQGYTFGGGEKNLGVTPKPTATFGCSLLWQVLNSFLSCRLLKTAFLLLVTCFWKTEWKATWSMLLQRLMNLWRVGKN